MTIWIQHEDVDRDVMVDLATTACKIAKTMRIKANREMYPAS